MKELLVKVPEEKEKSLRVFLETLNKTANFDLKIEDVPKELELFSSIIEGIKGIQNEVKNLRAKGFTFATDKFEEMMKLRDKYLFEGIAKMFKEFKKKETIVMPFLVKENPLKEKIQKALNLYDFPRLTEILVVLAEKKDWVATREIAEKVYGKYNKRTRSRVTQTLKKYKKWVMTKKEGRFMKYKLKKEILKKIR